jgi:hypothetical protein
LSILAGQELVAERKLSTMLVLGLMLAGPPESMTSPELHDAFIVKVPSPNCKPGPRALSLRLVSFFTNAFVLAGTKSDAPWPSTYGAFSDDRERSQRVDALPLYEERATR